MVDCTNIFFLLYVYNTYIIIIEKALNTVFSSRKNRSGPRVTAGNNRNKAQSEINTCDQIQSIAAC